MPRLSDRQANVVYSNARFLDLPYKKERWLLEKAHITDMEASDCNDLIGSIFEYMRFKPSKSNEDERIVNQFRGMIEKIVDRYMDADYEIELSKHDETRRSAQKS